jgi:hypothetical protein
MAGLNKEKGEFVPELGNLYRVVPNSKWQGSPLMADACEHAAEKFKDSGAPPPIKFFEDNILVQEYPLTDKLVFFFCYRVRGTDMYTHYEWKFDPEAIGELKASGMWDDFSHRDAVH